LIAQQVSNLQDIEDTSNRLWMMLHLTVRTWTISN